MSARPPHPPGVSDASALPELLAGLLWAQDPAAVCRVAARALFDLGGVRAAAVYRVRAERIEDEQLVLDPDEPPGHRAEILLAAAREALAEPDGSRRAGNPRSRRIRPWTRVLRHRGKATIAIVLWPRSRRALRGSRCERVDAVIEVLGARIAGLREQRRLEAQLESNDRWFRTLDGHLRTLDRERQKFAEVVNQTNVYAFAAGPDGVVRWLNRSLGHEIVAEHGTGKWVGRRCEEVFRALGHEGGDEPCPVIEAQRLNQTFHGEFHGRRGDERRNFYVTVLPIKGPEGEAQEALVLVQDLSDLEVLRRSEARYRMLFERTADGILMADPQSHRILLANQTASRILGHAREALHELALPDLHPAEEWERLRSHYAGAAAGEITGEVEAQLLTSEGAHRIARVEASLFDLEGRPAIMVRFRDVTLRRRVEVKLREAEERLQAVVANSPIVLFSTDASGVFTLSEGKGLERLDLEPGEVVGRSVFEIYRDHPQICDSVRRALDGESFTTTAIVGEAAFEVHYEPIRGPEGRVTGLIGLALDVSERKRLEDTLRQSQKMEAVGRLAGGVAHDFNNLLTAILGHSELLIARMETQDPLRDDATEIHRSAMRGALLTNQLLAFSRKELPTLSLLDVNRVVKDMEGLLKRLIGEDVTQTLMLGHLTGKLRADRTHVEQILMNLVVNARDAMPQGGRLVISTDEIEIADEPEPEGALASGRYACLLVNDTGCGMDQETLARLFEPFFTTKEQGKGTGLGLSTVYGIVQQYGGDVQVESYPERGTTVRVYLPLQEGAERESEHASESSGLARGTETVLVVEDEEPVRELVRETLEMAGYTVLLAESGFEGWRVFRSRRCEIDLVVTDVVMPGMSGGELAKRIVNEDPGMRVLFISGYTDDAVVRHGVLGEDAPFLQKPFTLQALAAKARQLLDAPPPAACA